MKLPKHKKKKATVWGNKRDQKIYKSARWQTVREMMLSEDPFCKCGRVATVVDHVRPIRQGGSIWDKNNLQTMCRECHNSKTAKESNQ